MKVSFTHNQVMPGLFDIDSLLGPNSEGWFFFLPAKWFFFLPAKLRRFLFKRVFQECVTIVQFSNEELDVIHTRKLKGMIVFERDIDALAIAKYVNNGFINKDIDEYLKREARLTIEDLMGGSDRYFCDNVADARIYEQQLTNKLKELKDYLANYHSWNTGVPESKTIEI